MPNSDKFCNSILLSFKICLIITGFGKLKLTMYYSARSTLLKKLIYIAFVAKAYNKALSLYFSNF